MKRIFFRKSPQGSAIQKVGDIPNDISMETDLPRFVITCILAVALVTFHNKTYHIFPYREEYFYTIVLAFSLLLFFLTFNIRYRGRIEVLINFIMVMMAGIVAYAILQMFFNQDYVWRASIVEFLNYMCATLPFLIFLVITGRPSLSIIFGGTVIYILGLGNHMVMLFRGEPLLVHDLFSAGTALDVSASYKVQIDAGMVYATFLYLFLIVVAFVLSEERKSKPHKRVLRLMATAVLTAFLLYFNWGTPEDFYYSWIREINGYPFTFCINLKMLNAKEPNNYKAGELAKAKWMPEKTITPKKNIDLQDNKTPNKATELYRKGVKPHIISIMSESLVDYRTLGTFDTNKDYMPFMHQMKENTIKGTANVTVFGGGTCDTEYAYLTGNTTAYVPANARPYQLYLQELAPNMATTLNQQGYRSHAIHPGEPDAWNRSRAYAYLGFEDFYSVENFSDGDYARGMFISDWANYAMVKKLYEERGDEPLFIHNVTIQNHGPFYGDISAYEDRITLEGLEGYYPAVEQYLTMVLETDKATEDLIRYFEQQDEPVAVVLFGDHHPKLEDRFYEEINGGVPMGEWSPEERQKRYNTPFFIWTNFDIQEKEMGVIGIQYLQSLVLRELGLDMPPYQQYLSKLMEQYPIINSEGVMDSAGHYYTNKNEMKNPEDLTRYQHLLYNNIHDVKHRVKDLYFPNADKLPDKKEIDVPIKMYDFKLPTVGRPQT